MEQVNARALDAEAQHILDALRVIDRAIAQGAHEGRVTCPRCRREEGLRYRAYSHRRRGSRRRRILIVATCATFGCLTVMQ